MTVVASTVSSMYELADSFLQAIVAAMTTTTAGAPDRAFIAPDTPVFETECGQAAVYIPTLSEEATSPLTPGGQVGQRFHAGRVNLVGMIGFAVRCAEISEGNQLPYQPPFNATLNGQAQAVYEDGWAIWNYVTALLNQKKLFQGPCGITHFDLGKPYIDEGGLMGWQFDIRVELNGYVPDTSGFPPPGIG